jgi:hypothetical protein
MVVVAVRSCVLVAMLMQLVEGAIGLLNAKLRRRHVQRNDHLLTGDGMPRPRHTIAEQERTQRYMASQNLTLRSTVVSWLNYKYR